MPDSTDRFDSLKVEWKKREAAAAPSQSGTGSGEEVLFLPDGLGDDPARYMEKLGFPGESPFTRGVYPLMYTRRPWTMRQYAGFGDAAETNRRFHYLLEQGQTGLSVAFDLPTQMGYDSDHPLAEGEVGKTGVAIDSIRDVETLFEGIDPAAVSVSMTINAPAAVLLAMYIVAAKRKGAASSELRGTVQNDVLKEYAARGTYIFPPKPSLRIASDIFRHCSRHVPLWNAISVSGYHIREAGATAVQEVAFTLANGVQYVTSAVEAGLNVDEFAGRLSFFFNAHNDLLEEVAKFRAARRMWARIMKERFGARDPRSRALRFHAQTAGSMLTAGQPDNNVVRVAYQALAAVLGGAQSLHANGRDEALSLPTEESARIALRTQQILANETGVVRAIDPLGGSYYVEALTDRIEAEAEALIRRIDEAGGAAAYIQQGRMQREIAQSAYEWQMDVERKRRIVVGVNAYRIEEPAPEIFRHNPEVEARQTARLKALRRERDAARAGEALERLVRAAREDGAPLMPGILDAVEAEVTLGEICEGLAGVFGRHRDAGF